MIRISALSFCLLLSASTLPQNEVSVGTSLWTGIYAGTLVACGLGSLLDLYNLYSLSQNKIPIVLWEDYEERYPAYAAKNMEKFTAALCNIHNFTRTHPRVLSDINNWLEAIIADTTIERFNFDRFHMQSKKEIEQMLVTTSYEIGNNKTRYPFTQISINTSYAGGQMIKNNLRNLMYYYPPTQTCAQTHYLIKQFKQYAYKKTAISLAILSFGAIVSACMIYID